jgi:hypothetical protein
MREHTIITPVAPAQLAAELAAALGLADPPPLSARDAGQVDDDGKTLSGVVAVPDDLDQAKVQSVIDAHVPAPPTDPDADLANAINAVDTSKIADAATKAALNALKAALLGSGKPSAVAGRPTGR